MTTNSAARGIHFGFDPGHLYVYEYCSSFPTNFNNDKLLTYATTGKLHAKGDKLLYSAALTFLWMLTIVSFLGDWVKIRRAFVVNSSSLLDITITLDAPGSVFWSLPGLMGIVISDAILVRITIALQQITDYLIDMALQCSVE